MLDEANPNQIQISIDKAQWALAFNAIQSVDGITAVERTYPGNRRYGHLLTAEFKNGTDGANIVQMIGSIPGVQSATLGMA